MAKSRDQLIQEFADNNKGRITAAKLRDFLDAVKLWGEQRYTHIQTSPASHWDIHHNLGGKPDITIYTDDGYQTSINAFHVNENLATIDVNASSPIKGKAICRL